MKAIVPPRRNLRKTPVNPDIPVDKVLEILAKVYPYHPMSEVTGCDPFKVLITCIMSLRTRDDMTIPLAEKMFREVSTVAEFAQLSVEQIERYIYPVGFYKTKARSIKLMCERIVSEFNGEVPDEIDTLLQFTGVGRKTANLVVSLGFNKPALCVDIHVHRISNRLGYIVTKTPDETEWALREKVPDHLWGVINRVLVRHGQECCKPIGALCYACPIENYCAKIDVKQKKPPTQPLKT